MSSSLRPQLRPYLAVARIDSRTAGSKEFVLYDRLRLSSMQIPLSSDELECLKLFDGTRSLGEIQALISRWLGGISISLDILLRLTQLLDQALFLQSETFFQAMNGSVRKPRCVGVYSDDPGEFRHEMKQLFESPNAAGLPGKPRNDDAIRAVLAPHIDYQRGGTCYTYAFKELFESTSASLFVIIGTSHYCGWKRFTLTRKDFQTPLGIVPTDQRYVDRLVEQFGPGLFDDEWIAHLPEHSIELEVVILHYLYEKKRDVRIVPLVVGSFQDCIDSDDDPAEKEDLRRMIDALQQIERELDEPICYVISGDLAHVGPKFGASHPVRPAQLRHSKAQDLALLEQAARADERGYFEILRNERDERNTCGLPPTWLTLAATKPKRGQLLDYGQYVEPKGYESVSFASMAFYR